MNPNYNDGRCCFCGADDPTCEERCVLQCEAVQADCITHMKSMDAESVDLICTSPPYKAEKSYESWASFLALRSKLEAECAQQIFDAIATDELVPKGLGAAHLLKDAVMKQGQVPNELLLQLKQGPGKHVKNRGTDPSRYLPTDTLAPSHSSTCLFSRSVRLPQED